MTENDYIMWLNAYTHISTNLRVQLYEYFGSAENVWKADAKSLLSIGITGDIADKIEKSKDIGKIENTVKFIKTHKTKYITVNDPTYPTLLKNIPDYPLGIFVLGELPDENEKRVAVVGTRNADEYGYYMTRMISCNLSKNGVVIVSGMAEGIDSSAQRAAIDSGGKTIAVIGCGIDVVYPRSNRELEKDICRNGCVITEYAPGTPPFSSNFPIRNRIIAGLSDITAVIQAPLRSGAVITANLALDYGRGVYAVPGNVTNYKSEGANKLLQDGACVLLSYNDILFDLGVEEKAPARNKKKSSKKNETKNEEKINNDIPTKLPKDENCAKVLEYIQKEPLSIDDIALKSGIDMSTLNTALLMLEFDGYIEKLSANRFVKR